MYGKFLKCKISFTFRVSCLRLDKISFLQIHLLYLDGRGWDYYRYNQCIYHEKWRGWGSCFLSSKRHIFQYGKHYFEYYSSHNTPKHCLHSKRHLAPPMLRNTFLFVSYSSGSSNYFQFLTIQQKTISLTGADSPVKFSIRVCWVEKHGSM